MSIAPVPIALGVLRRPPRQTSLAGLLARAVVHGAALRRLLGAPGVLRQYLVEGKIP